MRPSHVRFPLAVRGVDPVKIEVRLQDAADKLHIGHILHKMPGQLSSGERQRVAIARALVRDPVAYLMDDPISALDARLRQKTRVELKRLQREAGRTLIYVTGDPERSDIACGPPGHSGASGDPATWAAAGGFAGFGICRWGSLPSYLKWSRWAAILS